MEPEPTAWDPESNNALDSITWGKGIAPVPRIQKKLCKEEIEETKQTYLTNNPLNSPWFLNLNPFLIRKHYSRCSC